MRRLDGKPRNMPRPNCRPGEKRCGTCKEWKALDQFFNSQATHDGKGGRCKPCDYLARKMWRENNPEQTKEVNRRRNLRSKYGLTLEQFNAMLEEQGGVCKICGSDRRLVVDHDHETQKIRGILCNSCNRGLGYFKDSATVIRAAAIYIETH